MPEEYEQIDSLNLYPGPGMPLVLSLWRNVSDVVTKNELSYSSSPSRMENMQLKNDQNAYYVPTVEFTLNDLSRDDYYRLMQIVNSKGFCVWYFDFELGERVYRSMYATESSIEALIHTKARFDGANGVKVKFVSRYGYPYTPRSDSNFDPNNDGSNKYHMYQLHAHRSPADNNFLPDGTDISEENGYV